MIRSPFAHYYAMFQDDFIISRNVRPYIEATYPIDGYLNLYTFPKNQVLSQGKPGWYYSNQKGLGAVALIFDRQAAVALVSEPHMANKPAGPHPERRHKFVDGGIVDSLRKCGISEYVHSPSVVQHLGYESTLANPKHAQARSFRGEDFDMLTLLTGEK